ncbi:MAG: DUF2905 domain-containing protein [Anaerolineales bacterium]|jgi:uncharacterized metal-binding protein
MQPIVKIFLLLGVFFLALAGLVTIFGKLNLPLGRLPGDFRFQSGNVMVYLPCATSIVLSILLTLLLNLILRWIKK